MQTDASSWDSLVFGGIDDVDVETVTAAFGTVHVVARGRAAGAACPDRGCFSGGVHDSYQRKSAQTGGFSARRTERRDPAGDPALHLRRRRLSASYLRRAVPSADHFLCAPRHAAQPRSGTCRSCARWTGRRPSGGPTGDQCGADDLAAQGHGAAGPAVQRAVRAGSGRLRGPQGADLSTVLTCGETHRVVDVLPTRQ